MDLLLCHRRIVLRGTYHRIQTDGLSVFAVFHCHLGFSVGTQIGKRAVLSYFGQLTGQFMCQRDGIGHIFRRLVGGIAKHHTLISRADGVDLFIGHFIFFCFQGLIHTQSDIGGLLVDGRHHAAGIRIKAEFPAGVTDFTDRITDDFLDIHIGGGGDLAHHHHQAGRRTGFAGYPAHGILFDQFIQDGVGNLIAHFIRMSFCYRF